MKFGAKATARGVGRYVVSGSTRYTTPKGKRLRTWGTVTGSSIGGSIAGSAVGYGVGHALGGHSGAHVGARVGYQAGAFGGAVGGRKIARSQGWTHRDKQRMTVRAYHGIFHSTHQDIRKAGGM